MTLLALKQHGEWRSLLTRIGPPALNFLWAGLIFSGLGITRTVITLVFEHSCPLSKVDVC